MPNARKKRSRRPCAECGAIFVVPVGSGNVRYCPKHRGPQAVERRRLAKRGVNRRRLGAAERSPDYYKPKVCAEPRCGEKFTPRTGSALYCDEHQGIDRWKRDNPENAAAVARNASRRHRHKKEFGDPDIYAKCVAIYGELCGVCGAPPSEGFHLAVDRDHATDKARGLLCPPHNTGLGYFAENPTLLRAAADYLERPPVG